MSHNDLSIVETINISKLIPRKLLDEVRLTNSEILESGNDIEQEATSELVAFRRFCAITITANLNKSKRARSSRSQTLSSSKLEDKKVGMSKIFDTGLCRLIMEHPKMSQSVCLGSPITVFLRMDRPWQWFTI
jgi:hypothetical protein